MMLTAEAFDDEEDDCWETEDVWALLETADEDDLFSELDETGF